jgi:hypothetical protein
MLPPTLTLTRFPQPPKSDPATPPTLSHIFTTILPLFTTIPLSLTTLNDTSFFPESKQEDLHAGWLQLPSGSSVLVTESGVNEGTVNDRGP